MRPSRCCAGRLPTVVAVLLVAHALPATSQRCSRQPEGTQDRPLAKTVGSGGYRIEVSGNHTKYEPGQRYQIVLLGDQNKYVRKFTGYYLTVESAVPLEYGTGHHVGNFQRYSNPAVRFLDECPNTVMHTSEMPKSSVALMWVAPSPGSGCVVFRATVIEGHGAWFKDDNTLSYKLCEHVRENHDEQPTPLLTCCACDEAKYEVTFEGLWSRNTHPRGFPTGGAAAEAAFSDVIGASHSANYRFWEEGGLASEGVRQVAEWGDTKKLENELKNHSEKIRTIIKARGLKHPNLQGRTFAVFRVDRLHHQASLMSRLKPSPDWLVGVAAMELCLSNCSWAEHRVLNLRPWDAGTKNGESYSGSHPSTNPKETIRRITSSWPANSPFYDPTDGKISPLARLIMRRQRLYNRQCADGRARPATASFSDCATTSWSEWSACSATCGEGRRTRKRYYRTQMRAGIKYCNVALRESSPCSSSFPCDGNGGFTQGVGIRFDPYDRRSHSAPGSIDCALGQWSHWGTCSTSCGPGERMRSRLYKSRLGRKWCTDRTTETRDCTDQNPPCEGREHIPAGCEVSPWSEWSPCPVTCGGPDVQQRDRVFLNQPEPPERRCEIVKRSDTRSCNPPRSNCSLAYSEAVSICKMPVERGTCRGSFMRWYYSEEERSCVQFPYSGCEGNQNRFITLSQCEEICGAVLHAERFGSEFGTRYIASFGGGEPHRGGYGQSSARTSAGGRQTDMNQYLELLSSSQVINPLLMSGARSQPADCPVGEWSAWSSCTASCGRGVQERHRQPLHSSQAGTPGCGQHRLVRRRQCLGLPSC